MLMFKSCKSSCRWFNWSKFRMHQQIWNLQNISEWSWLIKIYPFWSWLIEYSHECYIDTIQCTVYTKKNNLYSYIHLYILTVYYIIVRSHDSYIMIIFNLRIHRNPGTTDHHGPLGLVCYIAQQLYSYSFRVLSLGRPRRNWKGNGEKNWGCLAGLASLGG